MRVDPKERVFELSEVEVETLRRAALERQLPFDASRISYTARELSDYGLVREAYNSNELSAYGITSRQVVTSFDDIVRVARDNLVVDAPFLKSGRKWQVPVDVTEWRSLITEFPPNSFVEPHVHPENSAADPGGSMRIILKGSISYAGKIFRPGDWFHIPNGVPYSFRTDRTQETMVYYKYAFFAASKGNRFSYPLEIEKYRQGNVAVA